MNEKGIGECRAVTLTNSVASGNFDNLTGTSGNDTFIGGPGAAETGDIVNGGAGTDTLQVRNAADGTNVLVNGVEKVFVRLDATNAARTFSLASNTGVTEAWADRVEDTDATGNGTTLTIAGISKAVTMGVVGAPASSTAAGARGNATFTLTDVAGSADTATLALDSARANNVTIAGVETLNVKGMTGASTVSGQLVAQQANKLVFSGDQNITIADTDLDQAFASGLSVDASAMTGNLNIRLSEVAKQTFVGGSGNDTVQLRNTLTANDSIDGGTGSNTVGISTSATLTQQTGAVLKNFQSVDIVAGTTGNYDMDFITGGGTATTITSGIKVSGALTDGQAVTIDNLAVGAGLSFSGSADTGAGGAETIVINQKGAATAGRTTDTFDISIAPTATTGDINAANITVANVETINVASNENAGYSAGHTIQALTATGATTLKLTGAEQLTVTAATLAGGNVKIDASAMTDKFIMGAAFGGGATQAITGGSADDTLIANTVANSVLQGNGGADNITLGAGGVAQTVKYAAVSDSQAGVGKFDFVSGFNVGAVAGGAAAGATYTITAAQVAALTPGQTLNVTTAGPVVTPIVLGAVAASTDVTAASLAAQLTAAAAGVYTAVANADGTVTVTTVATGAAATLDVETAVFAGRAAVNNAAVVAADADSSAAFTITGAVVNNLVAGQTLTLTLTNDNFSASATPIQVTLTGSATGVPTLATVTADINAAINALDATSSIAAAVVGADVVVTSTGVAGGATNSVEVDINGVTALGAVDLAGAAKTGTAAVAVDAADLIDLTFLGLTGAARSVALTNKAVVDDAGAAGATTFTITDANAATFFTNGGVQTGIVYQTGGTNADTLVFIDADKNGAWNAATDMVIELTGVNTAEAAGFTAANFVFTA